MMLTPLVQLKLNQQKCLAGVSDYVPLGSTNKQCYDLLTKRITELESYVKTISPEKFPEMYQEFQSVNKEINSLKNSREAIMDKDPNALYKYSSSSKIEIPLWYTIAAAIAGPACAYHGYKRNKSVGWAIWWGFCGSAAPVLAPVIAMAQGFGKERKD
jgi:hypothetical protein